uniref:Uncharacterized protein n=1 Tax=Oryza sativa subsp. japonica TaxID=39947 RepID=Q67WQ4_ORYSJ|nr:hypothetical protein [Oryza sativa Japonica Group]
MGLSQLISRHPHSPALPNHRSLLPLAAPQAATRTNAYATSSSYSCGRHRRRCLLLFSPTNAGVAPVRVLFPQPGILDLLRGRPLVKSDGPNLRRGSSSSRMPWIYRDRPPHQATQPRSAMVASWPCKVIGDY